MEYYIDPTTRYPPQTVKVKPELCKTGVRLLEEIFNPCGTRASVLQSTVLVSLDLEYSHPAGKLYQIGVATFDTRDLSNLSIDDSDETFRTVIGRRLFLLQQNPEPRHQHSRPYLFGSAESVRLNKKQLEDLLRPLLIPLDELGRPRNVVLVGQTVAEDVKALRWYTGIDLWIFSSIKAVVDISTMAGGIYDGVFFKYASLKVTCEYLGLGTKHLHNAGNDAFFTLLALLLLFHHYELEKQQLMVDWTVLQRNCPGKSRGLPESDQRLLWECQLELLRRIGRAPHANHVVEKQKKKVQQPRSVVQNNLGDITDGIVGLFDQYDLTAAA